MLSYRHIKCVPLFEALANGVLMAPSWIPGTLMLDSVLSLIACVLIKYLVKDFERKRQLTASLGRMKTETKAIQLNRPPLAQKQVVHSLDQKGDHSRQQPNAKTYQNTDYPLLSCKDLFAPSTSQKDTFALVLKFEL